MVNAARSAAVVVLVLVAMAPSLAGTLARVSEGFDSPDMERVWWVAAFAFTCAVAALGAVVAWTTSAAAELRFRLLALAALRVAAALIALLALGEPAWQVWQLALALALLDGAFWLAVLHHAGRLWDGCGAASLARSARQLGALVLVVKCAGVLLFFLPTSTADVYASCYRAALLVLFAAVAVTLLVLDKHVRRAAAP